MNWFVDRHHDGLAYSIRLLAKRLGATCYFPIGMEWANDYWQIHRPYNYNLSTAKQYLSLNQDYTPIDGTLPLNTIKAVKPTHYEVKDLYHGDVLKAITLDQFKEMDIDVVIASIPDHVISFTRLIKDHKPKAKLVFQMGNMFNELPALIENNIVKNLLAATIKMPLPKSVNAVFYHEEQPMREYKPPLSTPKIKSFVHLLPNSELYYQYKNALPEVEFKSYGAGCPDGYMDSLESLYDGIQDSNMILQIKNQGDGFGWNWHSAYMLGRPVITNFSDYRDKLGGLLFGDCITGIDLEARPFNDNIKVIKYILEDDERLFKMSMNAFNRFNNIVDYDKEQKDIDKFFSFLQ